MHKKSSIRPKLVSIADKRGDDLTPAHLAQKIVNGDRSTIHAATVLEDFQAVRRRPLDAPRVIHMPPSPFGRLAAMLFMIIIAFISGLIVGRLI